MPLAEEATSRTGTHVTPGSRYASRGFRAPVGIARFNEGHVLHRGLGLIGDEALPAGCVPVALRLIARCDAVLRIGGASAGADRMVAQADAQGKRVYTSIADIPPAA